MGMILNWVYETKQELNNPDQVRVDCIVVEADFLSSGLHNIYSYSLLPKELGNLYFHQLIHFVMFVLRRVYLHKKTTITPQKTQFNIFTLYSPYKFYFANYILFYSCLKVGNCCLYKI